MEVSERAAACMGKRFSIEEGGREVARAYLFTGENGLHEEPWGLMEDVFVAEDRRNQGWGVRLIRRVIEAARAAGCYKLIATSRYSRPEVHELYLRLGFKDYGKEFRMDLAR